MKYLSKKFYRTNERDEILLYFLSILALIQIFYLVMHKKYIFILLFFAIGIILNFFMKNQSIILILDIILINILLNVKKHEGLANKNTLPAKRPASTSDSKTTPITHTTQPNTKNNTNKKSSNSVSKNASPVTPTLDSKENFGSIGKNGQISQVGEHIKALDGLLEKFNGMTSKLNLFGK